MAGRPYCKGFERCSVAPRDDDTAGVARYPDVVLAPLPLLLLLTAAPTDDAPSATNATAIDEATTTPASNATPATTTPATATPATATTTPATAMTTTAGPRRITRSLATTAWPVEPAVSAGFVLVGDSMVPWAGATAFSPLYFSTGPLVAGRVLGTTTGLLDVIEGVVGAGIGWQGRLGDVRARAGLVPGLLFSRATRPAAAQSGRGGDDAARPATIADVTSTAVMVPLELALPLGGGVSFTGVVEPTISTKATYVDDSGAVAYARDRFFVFVGVGLDVGGPVD
jgi:hypothetical protein